MDTSSKTLAICKILARCNGPRRPAEQQAFGLRSDVEAFVVLSSVVESDLPPIDKSGAQNTETDASHGLPANYYVSIDGSIDEQAELPDFSAVIVLNSVLLSAVHCALLVLQCSEQAI